MIFVVKTGMNRNSLEKRDIRDRIYKELNQEGKHLMYVQKIILEYS